MNDYIIFVNDCGVVLGEVKNSPTEKNIADAENQLNNIATILKNISVAEKYHMTCGRCFEFDIDSHDVGKSQIGFVTQMPVYIFVQLAWQFFENSRSRVEIQLKMLIY